ncbi:MAG: lipocalin-like domain-containing protein [Candidatus Alcyoniella australis]|nr:lipocalin-like domain-containing protein [Candidatus Alcyoniella australis]
MRRIVLLLALIFALTTLGGCPNSPLHNPVKPDYQLSFPRDHWAHDNYYLEWWYFTGHLEADNGERYGFELVFFKKHTEGEFRLGVPVWWVSNPAYVSHFTITDMQGRTFNQAERIGLKKPLRGGASSDKFVLWNEDWRAMQLGEDWYLSAQMPGYGIDLLVNPLKPPVLHGENGYSRKGEQGGASYYTSLTRLEVKGTMVRDGEPLRVSGQAWMDHEVLSPTIAENLVGWDWFSIQLDNDHELMLFTLHTSDGGIDPCSSGTIVMPDGSYEHFYSESFEIRPLSYWTSEESRAKYPSSWRIKVPQYDVDLVVLPVLRDQEVRPRLTQITYWEGAVGVQGTLGSQTVSGQGYVELSGYDKPIDL